MTIGIYKLNFTGTDKVYIGQSVRIEERFRKHKERMKNGVASDKLQKAYSLYGTPSLEILLEADENEDLDSLENEAILVYDAVVNGFNTRDSARGGGSRAGENHPRSMYSNEDIIKAFKLLQTDINSFAYIEKCTNISVHTIRDISKGKSHKWLKSLDSDAYEYMLSKIGTRTKNTLSDKEDKEYIMISPEGVEVKITNISEFARINNLNKSHVSGVLHNIRQSHKGWTLKKEQNG